ncbi:hypothetical protein R3P38DRAFT_2361416, partial [Favolaschia claudopus]
LFAWICNYDLEVMSHPINITTKIAVLSIRKRDPPPLNARKLFTFENVEIYERRHAAQLVGDAQFSVFFQHLQEADEQAKREGHVGAAGLLIFVKTAEGELASTRCTPVVITREALALEPDVGWKGLVKNIIDDGINLRRRLAEKER